jgi:hypothetical protein
LFKSFTQKKPERAFCRLSLKHHKMKNTRLVTLFSLLLVVIAACTYDQRELPTNPNDCDTDLVSYRDHIQPLVQSACTGCHSGNFPSAGLNLVGYENLRRATENGAVLNRVQLPSGNPQMMPPGQRLSDCQIATFEAWRTQGFPQ